MKRIIPTQIKRVFMAAVVAFGLALPGTAAATEDLTLTVNITIPDWDAMATNARVSLLSRSAPGYRNLSLWDKVPVSAAGTATVSTERWASTQDETFVVRLDVDSVYYR